MEKKLYDTLFLDRDGVINQRTSGVFIQKWEDFIFEKNALQSIVKASNYFERILVVTNQSGLEKRLLTEETLIEIHQQLQSTVEKNGGRIEKIYYCPHKAFSRCGCRKPALGMAHQAKEDFPTIDFSKSVMVGDSISDIEFGKSLGMKTVLVAGKLEEYEAQRQLSVDFRVENLAQYVDILASKQI